MTDNQKIADDIDAKKSGLIPADVRRSAYFKDSGWVFSLTSFHVKGKKLPEDLDHYVDIAKNKSNGIIVIYQQNLEAIARRYNNAFFMGYFELYAGLVNTQNLLGKVLSKALRDFAIFSGRFNDHKYQKILLLPLRNFRAEDLLELRSLFITNDQRNVFGEQLDGLLGRLRKRQTPKRPKTHSVEYLVDDRSDFYNYGPERHARPDSAIPPHSHVCALAHEFRFGHSYDSERHFNVSREPEEAKIGGDYLDCHDNTVSISSTTHINMFPNDFSC